MCFVNCYLYPHTTGSTDSLKICTDNYNPVRPQSSRNLSVLDFFKILFKALVSLASFLYNTLSVNYYFYILISTPESHLIYLLQCIFFFCVFEMDPVFYKFCQLKKIVKRILLFSKLFMIINSNQQ